MEYNKSPKIQFLIRLANKAVIYLKLNIYIYIIYNIYIYHKKYTIQLTFFKTK